LRPDARPVLTQVVLSAVDGHPIHARTALVASNAFPHLLRAHVFKRAQSLAHASDLRARGCIRATGPSVVILSAGMLSVTEAPIREQMQSLHRDLTSAPIIVMSDREEIEEICAAFQEGARGFIPTSLEPHLVIGAIRMVLAGVTFVPVNALMRPRRAPNCNTERTCPEPATIEGREDWPPRQRAVLRFLLQGKANKEIARALELEESTIKVHVRLIMRKLGVTKRTQAALSVRQLGLPMFHEGPLLWSGKDRLSLPLKPLCLILALHSLVPLAIAILPAVTPAGGRPSRARQITQCGIAQAAGPVPLHPIIYCRACYLVASRHNPGAVASVEVEQRLSAPQQACVLCAARKPFKALPIMFWYTQTHSSRGSWRELNERINLSGLTIYVTGTHGYLILAWD
jgi:DNA-binding NarL/FixJ family response regulator